MAELSKNLSFLIRPSLRGREYRHLKKKTFFSQNYSQHIKIDSVFDADSESGISFEQNRSFLTKHRLKKVSNAQKLHNNNNNNNSSHRLIARWGQRWGARALVSFVFFFLRTAVSALLSVQRFSHMGWRSSQVSRCCDIYDGVVF